MIYRRSGVFTLHAVLSTANLEERILGVGRFGEDDFKSILGAQGLATIACCPSYKLNHEPNPTVLLE